MKVTLFTSNQPRHVSLINSIAKIADEVFAIQECNTVFPGKVKDFFNNSDLMQTYFSKVIAAEKKVFNDISFLAKNVRSLSLKSGDLNALPKTLLSSGLNSDIYIVFGASYIKGELIKFLVEQKAINIHMGVSPYYRGSSCNFWAAYDGRPELVGATIHMLSEGLDSGKILYHALPKAAAVDPFELGMLSVKVAHDSLVERISSSKIFSYEPVEQDKSKEMRYTKNIDFNDEIVKDYLEHLLSPEEVFNKLSKRDTNSLYNPFFA